MPYLTFFYISFTKIICQNTVKKNCKYQPAFPLKKRGVLEATKTRKMFIALAGSTHISCDDVLLVMATLIYQDASIRSSRFIHPALSGKTLMV